MKQRSAKKKTVYLAAIVWLVATAPVHVAGGGNQDRGKPKTVERATSQTKQSPLQFGTDTEWPRWRGPYGNGVLPAADWNPASFDGSFKVLWQASVGKGYSSLAIKGGYAYTMGNADRQDTVYCFEAATGELVWSYAYSCGSGQYPGTRATPTIDDGRVYTLSTEGHLHSFDTRSGKVLWQRHLVQDYGMASPRHGFTGSLVVSGNLIILNTGVSGLALDKRTGKRVWAGKSGHGGYATPILFDYQGQRYAAIFGAQALSVVNVNTGVLLSSHRWITSFDINAADPLVVGRRIFITSAYGKGCGLLEIESSSLNLLWQNKNIKGHYASPVYIDDYIYGMDGDVRYGGGRLVCLDIKTGEVVWSEDMGTFTLIAIGDWLLVLDDRGTLRVVEATPDAYREIASAKVMQRGGFTPPAFSDGRFYLRNTVGDVVCIDARAE